MATVDEIREALRRVRYPGFSRDIVSFGIVRAVRIEPGGIAIALAPPADAPDLLERLRPEIERELGAVAGPTRIRLEAVPAAAPARSAPTGPRGIPGVRRIVAVASGKGGVGKSTVAANLAVALEAHGSIGLLDADVYGPSAPLLLGAGDGRGRVGEDRRIEPLELHGLRLVSMGFFLERGQPVIWRGPMVTKLVTELLRNVAWGELDYLVLDLPPGTGDVQLTLAQRLAMTGGVIVTTPQEVALADVRRGVRMFEQMSVPVLGLIENMSGVVCRRCGHEAAVFGRGGGERTAAELGIRFLGALPLALELGRSADEGRPLVSAEPGHPVSRRFQEIAAEIAAAVD